MKPGIEIGNYVLEELLERGNRGEVWLAYRELATGGRTTVVVRFPHAASELDPRVRDGMQDEARLHMQLQHSNIPRVLDMGLHEGQPYFVTDFIAGRSLADLLVSLRVFGTPLRFELVAHLAREIGYALRYAHGFALDGVSRPVLHRDVAPENVLLSSQGAVYVVDFGVSEAAGIHSSSGSAKSSLVYKAPEHVLGFPTPKSDGWGLGAIMWEMLEGRPFRGDMGADGLPRAAKDGRHDPLTREGVPEVLQQVTEGLLIADIHERLSLDDALRRLEGPELPVQRMALADVVKDCFGDSLHRLGRARPSAEPSVHPDPSLAVTRVLEDDGPFGLNAWGREPEDEALPPPPAWASMSAPEASEAAEPPPSEASEPPPSEASEPPPSEASEPPPSAAPKPDVEAAPPAPAPIAGPRKTWSASIVVPVLGLAVAGLAWAVWPGDAEPEATTTRPATPDRSASEPRPTPEPPPSDGAVETPVEPEPAESKAPVEPEPAESKAPVEPEPSRIADASKDPNPPRAKPKANSEPARKKASGPPAQLAIELMLMADMDLEINGTHFSLGLQRTTAKTSVAPGKVRVRWRRPFGAWKSKSFEVEPGASYRVRLDDRGPTLKKRA